MIGHGQASHASFFLNEKTTGWINMVRGRDRQANKRPPGQTPCGQKCGNKCLRNQNSTVSENLVEFTSTVGEHKTKYACIVEADESVRIRMEGSHHKNHADHIAGKGENSLQHYNLVHKFVPMPQGMKIPAAKAVVDKEWEKLEKISAWNLTKVKSKKQVICEARMSGATVHFAS